MDKGQSPGANRNFNKKMLQISPPGEDSNVNTRPTTVRMTIKDQCEQARGVEVTYTDDPVEVEACLRNNVIEPDTKALGFDMEWKPQWVARRKGGRENKTAVLQLSTESVALVLHIIHMKTLPRFLVGVLADESICKLGCVIRNDVTKLYRDTGLRCKGVLDLPEVSLKSGYNERHGRGLKSMATNILRLDVYKPKKVRCSNWELQPLKEKQIAYAALDAWMGVKLYLHMQQGNGSYERNEVNGLVDRQNVLMRCSICRLKFYEINRLQQHETKASHSQCNLCGRAFPYQVPRKHQAACFRKNGSHISQCHSWTSTMNIEPVNGSTCTPVNYC